MRFLGVSNLGYKQTKVFCSVKPCSEEGIWSYFKQVARCLIRPMELVDMTEERDWTTNVKSCYECESKHMMPVN